MTVKFSVISVTSFPETTALKFLIIESVWRLHFGNCTFMISKCKTILKDITMPVWMIKNFKLFNKWEQFFMSCQWRTVKHSEQGQSWDD